MLLEGFAKKFVDLYAMPPQWMAQPGEHPSVSPVARHHAQSSGAVTNLRHQVVVLNDLARHVVRLADGQRTREEVLDALVQAAERGELVINVDGGTVSEPARVRSVLAESLDRCLEQLARDALMCSESGSIR
jgi:methyltransferase-like protein